MASSPAKSDIEKQAQDVTNKSDGQQHHIHNGHRIRERLRHFVHPNGKRIHVAASPEEADQLKKRLSQIHSNDEFDVYISGTSDHLNALRDAQSHHEDRRENLRREHQEVYDRFSDVHNELASLAGELDRVTEHGVALDAHFNRFGYSAHIRSYDDGETPSASGATTPRGSIDEKSQYAELIHQVNLSLSRYTDQSLFQVLIRTRLRYTSKALQSSRASAVFPRRHPLALGK